MAANEVINNNSLHYFEGVEKLLEIWFAPNPQNNNADLRKIRRPMWDALLKSVRCEIISFSRNDQIDAYVLSESSMFVSKRRWILKTCGNTTPLQCLEPLLEMAEEIGYTDVEDLFYSRKNFKRPELQISPHRGFDEEVALLDSIFDDGRAYCLGSVNRECWYLYTLSRGRGGGGGGGVGDNRISRCIQDSHNMPDPDQTIEILMTELDPQVMAIFSKDECSSGIEATERAGIHKLIPGMVIDDYLFDPCGYSMNGIAKNISGNYPQGCYMTIHITPEPDFSYVSFESNVASSNYSDLISRVINTFQPGKFVVTIFANKSSPAYTAFREIDNASHLAEWKRRDIQYCRFPTYDLTYAHYCKFPS
ncbi:S-adenosylmethionine decarboxylase proenzyme isoform X1 [Episyrphus balteatus]|uniref:S-adenosylmethionine decarboxylase proenzyme isoform X1 n=1 Tax=Episyrphus balteatus TaxID=286459 RepID=UPI0024861BC1|nr:S-adenosylmethionine decarboxylase proenzyme isoform X1 [Episyrphus balteatus]XP_055836822.1 S-adenosylmethionine decarboxylase proenzyme isoform X1 [Episyrphus balteatus]